MSQLLILAAIIACVVGILYLSQATLGVGILAAACLLAILARISQAHSQAGQQMKALSELRTAIEKTSHAAPVEATTQDEPSSKAEGTLWLR